MRANFISQYAKDESKIQAVVERFPELGRAAAEMCHAFDLKVDVNSQQPDTISTLNLFTNEGFHAGVLSQKSMYGSPRGKDDYFDYTSPLVSKERASARSDRMSRDATKVTGIINALKKNREAPTTENIYRLWYQSLRYAFTTIRENRRGSYRIDLTDDQKLSLLKLFIDGDKISAEANRENLQHVYDEYRQNIASVKDLEATTKRFGEGCTAIGVLPNPIDHNSVIYVVGDVTYDDSVGPKGQNFRRYEDLTDSPVSTDAVIMRTYAQGQPWFDNRNQLGIPEKDMYIEDLDMSMGYISGNRWLIIPKRPA